MTSTHWGTSFVALFQQRLVYSKREVSIIVDVMIDGVGKGQKAFGPIVTRYPKTKVTRDIYRLLMFEVLTRTNLQIVSGEYIDELGAQVTFMAKKDPLDHKKKGTVVNSILLSKCDHDSENKPSRRNKFVLDYLWSQIKGKRGFLKHSRHCLEHKMCWLVNYEYGISTRETLEWVRPRAERAYQSLRLTLCGTGSRADQQKKKVRKPFIAKYSIESHAQLQAKIEAMVKINNDEKNSELQR